MSQCHDFARFGPCGIVRGTRTTAWLVGACLFALSARASAQTVIVPDPSAAPEHSELAGAVSLLVRSYLVTDSRAIVPRRELALAVEAMTGTAPGKTLAVPHEIALRLVERMTAESLVVWDLQVGPKGTTVVNMSSSMNCPNVPRCWRRC